MLPKMLRAGALAAAIAGVLPAAALAHPQPSPAKPSFDLEAHRGGIGLRSENTLASFGNAIRLGVSTLEMDVQVTKDDVAVISHDRQIDPNKCTDTRPLTPGDPLFPYAGKFIKDLTLAQIKTLDCGYRQLAGFPAQENVPGVKMPTLREVYNLVNRYHSKVKLNVESKFEAGTTDTQPVEKFVEAIVRETRRAHLIGQVTNQSFYWPALRMMQRLEPRIPVIALMNAYSLFDPATQKGYAQIWLGIDPADYGNDIVKAAATFHPYGIEPVDGVPQGGVLGQVGFQPFTTKALVDEAHSFGMKVIPWTIDDPSMLSTYLDWGVDGIITDYPERARDAMRAHGLPLPQGTPSPLDIVAKPQPTLPALSDALADENISTIALTTTVGPKGKLVIDSTPGARRPTLNQALDAIVQSGRDDLTLTIEAQPSGRGAFGALDALTQATQLSHLLRADGLDRRTTVESTNGTLRATVSLLDPRLQTTRKVPATIDDPAAMQQAIDNSDDAIVTDDAPTLIHIAKVNGLR